MPVRICGAIILLLSAPAAIGCEPADKPPDPALSARWLLLLPQPDGVDLVAGAVVAAAEDSGGVRLYKIIEVLRFPPPMTDALVMIAYHEKGSDFNEAAALWYKGGLTMAARIDVHRHYFRMRDYRVLALIAVTDADRSAKAVDLPPPQR